VRQAAVGMAVLDEFERLDLLKNAAEVGTRLTRELDAALTIITARALLGFGRPRKLPSV